jgi:hypothetical protein
MVYTTRASSITTTSALVYRNAAAGTVIAAVSVCCLCLYEYLLVARYTYTAAAVAATVCFMKLS